MNEAAAWINLIQGEDMLEKFEDLWDRHLEQKELNDEIGNFFTDFQNEEDVDDEYKELMKEVEEEKG